MTKISPAFKFEIYTSREINEEFLDGVSDKDLTNLLQADIKHSLAIEIAHSLLNKRLKFMQSIRWIEEGMMNHLFLLMDARYIYNREELLK